MYVSYIVCFTSKYCCIDCSNMYVDSIFDKIKFLISIFKISDQLVFLIYKIMQEENSVPMIY